MLKTDIVENITFRKGANALKKDIMTKAEN